MNAKDRKRLETILKQADTLLNAGTKDNNIRTIDVIEAVLAGVGDVLSNKDARELAKLIERDEAVSKCECPTPDMFHYTGCAVLIARFNGYTADGAPIRDGMAVWDYNLDPGYVNLSRLGDDGWFEVGPELCSPRGHSMNDVRVCVRHPSTGQLASDALKGRKTR